MRFSIVKTKVQKAEALYAYLAVAMCLAVFAVYCTSAFHGGAVAASNEIGALYRSWVRETAFYEFFGFSELEETIPPDSVHTGKPVKNRDAW